MSHLSCDCLQRCQGKSLRISNEITRNDCSQEGFPNEIDARALALATAPAPAPFSYSLALTGSAAVSVQRQALARIMAVVEDEAKMRRRHYAVDCHWAKTGVAGLVGCSTHPLTLRQALLVSLLSLTSLCLSGNDHCNAIDDNGSQRNESNAKRRTEMQTRSTTRAGAARAGTEVDQG